MYDIEQPVENRIVGNSVLSQRIGSPHNNRYSTSRLNQSLSRAQLLCDAVLRAGLTAL
jgi:hypothetical protein